MAWDEYPLVLLFASAHHTAGIFIGLGEISGTYTSVLSADITSLLRIEPQGLPPFWSPLRLHPLKLLPSVATRPGHV